MTYKALAPLLTIIEHEQAHLAMYLRRIANRLDPHTNTSLQEGEEPATLHSYSHAPNQEIAIVHHGKGALRLEIIVDRQDAFGDEQP